MECETTGGMRLDRLQHDAKSKGLHVLSYKLNLAYANQL